MKKIFHLDDNIELVEITEMVLGKDYEVHSRSYVEGIAGELSQFNPDLILIDHFIGEFNSEEILKDIHTAIPGFAIPVILYSASHDIEDKAQKLGAAGFIEKPSSIKYIKEYIDNFFKDND
ncbi:MAG: response regulator [Pedobacter sp.]|nr:MAG: response regulator [Pedobacter sp.]